MTYALKITHKPAYMHAVVTGRNSPENVRRYAEAVMSECIARNCLRVLIEERLEGRRLGTLDVFSIASEGSQRYGNSRALEAIAFVDVNSEGDLMKFAEDVATNRGLPLKVFKTVAQAENWLLEKASAALHATAGENQPT